MIDAIAKLRNPWFLPSTGWQSADVTCCKLLPDSCLCGSGIWENIHIPK